MKALWVVTPFVKQFASGNNPERALLQYPIASTRMRTAVAALEWKRGGNENVFCDPETSSPGEDIDWAGVKACIVPKFFADTPLEPWYRLCVTAKDHRCPLVIDISDYPFKKAPVIQSFYSEVLKICDAVVANSERMADLMAPHVSRRPLVIEDAILGPTRNPEFAPARRLGLLWFGHPTNLQYLVSCLNSLAQFATQRPCGLTLLTEGEAGAEKVTQDINTRFAPALQARFEEWTLESMASLLLKSDLVLIPNDPSNPLKAGVSANRIAETFRAGRFPVASPMPSYLPFSDCAWLGEDLTEGIRWALENPGEVRARIRRGQALVKEQFAAEKIGQQWCALFENLGNFHNL
jgi:hypothetical protein